MGIRINETPCIVVVVVNRGREKVRPKNPTNLSFDVDWSNFPDDFLKADIVIRSRVSRRIKQRHLILATMYQLQ